MFFLSFQRLIQPSNAWTFSNVAAFSWIVGSVNWIFWLSMVKNQLKTASSTASGLLVFNFCRLTLDTFSSASKWFSLFLTHVDEVFLGTPYSAATSSCYLLFSKSLSAWHFSLSVLWMFFCFSAINIFKDKQ